MATSRICSVPECDNKVHTKRLCYRHFRQSPHFRPVLCSVGGCDRPTHRKGLCSAHSKRLERNGSTDSVISPKNAKLEWLKQSLAYDGDECLFFPFKLNQYGRGQFQMNGKAVFAATWVCEQTHGPRPSTRHEAAHSCGNGHLSCVAKRHLRWATFEENKADMVEHGTAPRGEKNANHVLTEAEVREILGLKGFVSQRALARRYNVSRSAIMLIHTRRNWAWLE